MEFFINELRVSFWRKEVFANFPHRCSASFSSIRHVERVTKAQERLCNRLNICLLCLFPFNVISRVIPVGLAWPWGADRPYSRYPPSLYALKDWWNKSNVTWNSRGGQMINLAHTSNCGRMFLFSQNESTSLVFQNIQIFLLQKVKVTHLSWFLSSAFSVLSLLRGQIIYRTVHSLRKIYFWVGAAIWTLAWSWLSPSWLRIDGTEKGKGIMLEKWNRFSFID